MKKVYLFNKVSNSGKLKTGEAFRFPVTGDTYVIQQDGSVRSNKIKLSKKERKQIKRERQQERRRNAIMDGSQP